MLELFGYLAFVEQGNTAERMERLDDAADEAGLRLVHAQGGDEPQRQYSITNAEPLTFRCTRGKRWTWASLDAMDRLRFSAYGVQCIELMLGGLNSRITPVVGRSFSGTGFGALEEHEGEGPIDFLDWYQYLGPAHVATWGMEYLLKGPFYRVQSDARGGCTLLLGASPFDVRLERRKAADYLGVRLRPLFAKNSKGERVPLEWE